MEDKRSIFILDEEVGDVDFPAYKTRDDKYNVLIRTDGYHLVYVFNNATGDYLWAETYFMTLEECQEYVLSKEGESYGVH